MREAIRAFLSTPIGPHTVIIMVEGRKRCGYCRRYLSKKLQSTARYCDVNCRTSHHRKEKKSAAPSRPSSQPVPISREDRFRLLATIRAHAPRYTVGYSIGHRPNGIAWRFWPPRTTGSLPYLRFNELPPPEWAGVFVLFYWTEDLRPLEAQELPQGLYLPRR